MSPTPAEARRSNGFLAETRLVPHGTIHPNDWNVNRLNAFGYAKLMESMAEYGFTDPLLVRQCPKHVDYEIIGGEHRWKAARDLGIITIPVVVIGADDATARKLSIIDNELHGQADPVGLGSLLKDLLDQGSLDDLMVGLPFTEEILSGFIGFDPMPPVTPAHLPPVSDDSGGGAGEERWVERTYRMPAPVADVLDDALARAREGEDIPDWQALERVAAEFLAS